MNDATARAELYSRLSEVLGIDHAGTLMAYLPGDEPATKSDLISLKAELTARFDGRMDALDERMDGLDRRMERFEDKLDERMDSFHHALLTQGRTYVIASMGSIFTTAGLVVAITQLL
ncbi:hypothetical protein BH23ACT5_BH23ACT5_01900 [soil metagenome]